MTDYAQHSRRDDSGGENDFDADGFSFDADETRVMHGRGNLFGAEETQVLGGFDTDGTQVLGGFDAEETQAPGSTGTLFNADETQVLGGLNADEMQALGSLGAGRAHAPKATRKATASRLDSVVPKVAPDNTPDDPFAQQLFDADSLDVVEEAHEELDSAENSLNVVEDAREDFDKAADAKPSTAANNRDALDEAADNRVESSAPAGTPDTAAVEGDGWGDRRPWAFMPAEDGWPVEDEWSQPESASRGDAPSDDAAFGGAEAAGAYGEAADIAFGEAAAAALADDQEEDPTSAFDAIESPFDDGFESEVPFDGDGYDEVNLANEEDDVAYMRLAIEQAHKAEDIDEVPIGAVVVCDGEVIAQASNRREIDADPAAHAEFLAIEQAAAHLKRWRLTGCTVYVTLEPCVMCAGLMQQARIDRCVYGAKDPKGGALGTLYDISSDARLNHSFEVTSGVLADECSQMLKDFFAGRR